ncbi:MAG: 4-hydroxy-tetrahydrodipicolinate synthase [Marinifilaceae bacterium]|jgi:4-hydroxy-tetrahydrodipicolinate synthase
MKKIKGTGVALITPFKSDMSVDFNSLGKLLKHVIKGCVDYLVVMGTTGEAATLTGVEKEEVIDFIINNSENLPVVLGIGGNNTQEVIDNINDCKFLDKIEAILSVVPFYNKPSQEGIYQHYKAIASSTEHSIIMYNVPGRTGVNMTAATCIRCAEDFNNIIGIKEASGDVDQVTKILKDKPRQFIVVSGEDGITFPLISLGVEGVISVVANAFPKDFSEMVSLCRKGEFKKALQYNFRLNEVIDAMFEEGNPAGVKAFLDDMGIVDNYLRLPLVPVCDIHRSKIGKLLSTY